MDIFGLSSCSNYVGLVWKHVYAGVIAGGESKIHAIDHRVGISRRNLISAKVPFHKAVQQVIEFSVSQGYLATENYDYSLKAALAAKNYARSDKDRLVRQLLDGVIHLQELDVSLDLSPRSLAIVCGRNGKMSLKISGYGVFKELQENCVICCSQTIDDMQETALYFSIEEWTGGTAERKESEIYCLSLVIVEILTGEVFLRGKTIEEMNDFFQKDGVIPVPDSCDDFVKWVMKHGLAKNPKDRPTAAKIKAMFTMFRDKPTEARRQTMSMDAHDLNASSDEEKIDARRSESNVEVDRVVDAPRKQPHTKLFPRIINGHDAYPDGSLVQSDSIMESLPVSAVSLDVPLSRSKKEKK